MQSSDASSAIWGRPTVSPDPGGGRAPSNASNRLPGSYLSDETNQGSALYNLSLNYHGYQAQPPRPLLYPNNIDFSPQTQESLDAVPIHRFSSQGVVPQDANNWYDGRNQTQYNYNGGHTMDLESVAMPMPTIGPGGGLILTPNNDSFAPSAFVPFDQTAPVLGRIFEMGQGCLPFDPGQMNNTYVSNSHYKSFNELLAARTFLPSSMSSALVPTVSDALPSVQHLRGDKDPSWSHHMERSSNREFGPPRSLNSMISGQLFPGLVTNATNPTVQGLSIGDRGVVPIHPSHLVPPYYEQGFSQVANRLENATLREHGSMSRASGHASIPCFYDPIPSTISLESGHMYRLNAGDPPPQKPPDVCTEGEAHNFIPNEENVSSPEFSTLGQPIQASQIIHNEFSGIGGLSSIEFDSEQQRYETLNTDAIFPGGQVAGPVSTTIGHYEDMSSALYQFAPPEVSEKQPTRNTHIRNNTASMSPSIGSDDGDSYKPISPCIRREVTKRFPELLPWVNNPCDAAPPYLLRKTREDTSKFTCSKKKISKCLFYGCHQKSSGTSAILHARKHISNYTHPCLSCPARKLQKSDLDKHIEAVHLKPSNRAYPLIPQSSNSTPGVPPPLPSLANPCATAPHNNITPLHN